MSKNADKKIKNPEEVTRHVNNSTQCELWGRAAGRCQFSGCNKILYKSPVTQERVNIAQKAHIYSFSKDGPRGWGEYIFKRNRLNEVANLMLVCHPCHQKIDDKGNESRYSAELLKQWKWEHELRIENVAGIAPDKKSHVVAYGSNIGDQRSPLQFHLMTTAMFPRRYPAEEKPIVMSTASATDDSNPEFWAAESVSLRNYFDRAIDKRIAEGEPHHFSLFALASQPLLILLGSLFTDKIPVDVYQPHREPQTWQWLEYPDDFEGFEIRKPAKSSSSPVLVISLSAKIEHSRVTAVLDGEHAIWELTIKNPYNGFLRSEKQLSEFREFIRKLMVQIAAFHPEATELKIFPAMPVSCAIELGRVRMPKADIPWIIYDQNHKHGKFIQTLTIGNKHDK